MVEGYWVNRDFQRKRANSAQVCRDILADFTIPTGSAEDKTPILVMQNNREPVNLWLYQIIGLCHSIIQFKILSYQARTPSLSKAFPRLRIGAG